MQREMPLHELKGHIARQVKAQRTAIIAGFLTCSCEVHQAIMAGFDVVWTYGNPDDAWPTGVFLVPYDDTWRDLYNNDCRYALDLMRDLLDMLKLVKESHDV